jgi:hypothetical protein
MWRRSSSIRHDSSRPKGGTVGGAASRGYHRPTISDAPCAEIVQWRVRLAATLNKTGKDAESTRLLPCNRTASRLGGGLLTWCMHPARHIVRIRTLTRDRWLLNQCVTVGVRRSATDYIAPLLYLRRAFRIFLLGVRLEARSKPKRSR